MATLADDLIGNLLNAGGLVGTAFAQGRQNQLAEQQGQQQLQLGQAKLNALAQANRQAQQYQQDVQAYSANPTPQALSQLMAKYPDQADAIKKSYDVLDAPARESRLATLGSLYYAADNNRPDLAANQIGAIIKAEQAAGHDTSEAEQIQAGLQSSDDATKRAALTQLKAFAQAHLAIADPKFAEAIIGKPESYTLEPGAAHFKNGVMDAHSPFVKGEDGAYYNWDDLTKGGGPASGGGGAGSGAPFDPRAFFKSFVLPHEGGYAAHDANGAPVNMGVNQAANPGVDVKNLTADQAADIFATKYAAKAASMPPALAGVYADTAYINPARAEQFLKASGGDPNKFLALRQAWMNSLIAKDPAKYQPYAKAWANRNRDLGQYIQQAGSADAASGAPQPLIPGKKKEQASFLTPTEIASAGLDPTKVYQKKADGTVVKVGDKGDAGVTIPGDPSKNGDAYLATLPSNIASQVKALSEGRLNLPSSFALSKPYWQSLLQATAQYDPTFDAANAATRRKTRLEFTSGPAARNITSFNTALGHLETLSKAADDLNNGNWHIWNNIGNAVENATGDPRLTRFETAKQAVVSELERAFRGSAGTVTGIKDWEKSINSSQSPAQLHAAITQMVDLLGSRINALGEQYNAGMGRSSDPINLLDKHAQQVMRKLGTGYSQPPRTAVNPKTGQRLGLVNGKWVPIK